MSLLRSLLDGWARARRTAEGGGAERKADRDYAVGRGEGLGTPSVVKVCSRMFVKVCQSSSRIRFELEPIFVKVQTEFDYNTNPGTYESVAVGVQCHRRVSLVTGLAVELLS